MANEIQLDGNSLDIEQVFQVAALGARVALAPAARARLVERRKHVDAIVKRHAAVYGVTTGFGKLSRRRDPAGAARRAAGEPRAQPRGRRRRRCSRSAKCAR